MNTPRCSKSVFFIGQGKVRRARETRAGMGDGQTKNNREEGQNSVKHVPISLEGGS